MDNWYRDEDANMMEALNAERKIRLQEVENTIAPLRRLSKKDVVQSFRYYPVRFLTEAAQAYMYLFNNASVFYSSLAVETALLVKLGQLNCLPKVGLRLDFKGLIEYASAGTKPVLSKVLQEKATNVRKLRNCYIHYYNIMTSQVIAQRRYAETFKKLQEQWPLERARLVRAMPPPELDILDALLGQFAPYFRSLAEDELYVQRAIPVENCLIRSDLQAFIEARIDQFGEWREGPEGKKALLEHGGEEAYTVEDYDARCCLEWATTVIAALGFLN